MIKRAVVAAGIAAAALSAIAKAEAPDVSTVRSTAEFWTWFAENEARFRNVRTAARESLLDEILSHLQAVSRSLFFEIGGHPDGPSELIITAEGRAEYFDLVKDVVSRAPTISGWKFVALKPPVGFDFITEFEGVRADPKELWFLPLENSAKELGLRIAGPSYQETLESQFRFACHQLLDGGLGEEAASAEIFHVEVGPLPDDPAAKGYIELIELPSFIEWRKSKVRPN